MDINPLNAELNPICHLLALLGAHHILHVSRIRVKVLGNYDVSCIYLAAGRVHWQVTVNVVTNSGLSELLFASQTEF